MKKMIAEDQHRKNQPLQVHSRRLNTSEAKEAIAAVNNSGFFKSCKDVVQTVTQSKVKSCIALCLIFVLTSAYFAYTDNDNGLSISLGVFFTLSAMIMLRDDKPALASSSSTTKKPHPKR